MSKRILKKTILPFFISGVLLSSTMMVSNIYLIKKYYDNVDVNYQKEESWNNSINNYHELKEKFAKYPYTEDEYQKDKIFFDTLYTQQYYMEGFDNKYHKGYIKESTLNILSYLKYSYLYQDNANDLIELKKISEKASLGNEIEQQKMITFFTSIRNNLNSSQKYNESETYFNLTFPSVEHRTKINNFNKLLKDNKLPELFPSFEQQSITRKILHDSFGDQLLYSNAVEKESMDYMNFVNYLEKNNFTNEQQYNFFKIMSFVKNEFSKKAEITKYRVVNYQQIGSAKNETLNYFKDFMQESSLDTVINSVLKEKNQK